EIDQSVACNSFGETLTRTAEIDCLKHIRSGGLIACQTPLIKSFDIESIAKVIRHRLYVIVPHLICAVLLIELISECISIMKCQPQASCDGKVKHPSLGFDYFPRVPIAPGRLHSEDCLVVALGGCHVI